MVIKVAITGPESTGKTSLCRFLSLYFDEPRSEEYARQYLEEKGPRYAINELDTIAKGQLEAQKRATAAAKKIVFFDTELTVIKIWSEVKFGVVSGEIERCYKKQKVDLFLLPFYDLPWAYDPLRESEKDRASLFSRYLHEMNDRHYNYRVIRGNVFDRNFQALNVIREFTGRYP